MNIYTVRRGIWDGSCALHITFCTFSIKYIYILVHHPNQQKNAMQNYKQQKANSVPPQPLITNLFFFCPHVILRMYISFQVYICCNPPPPNTHITGLISAYWREHMFSGFNYTFISGYTVMLSKDFCLNYLCSCEFPFFFSLSLSFFSQVLGQIFFSKRKEKGNTC